MTKDLTLAKAKDRMEELRVASTNAWAEYEKSAKSDPARAKEALRQHYAAENELQLLELELINLEVFAEGG